MSKKKFLGKCLDYYVNVNDISNYVRKYVK